jgi:GNAT superfamily N-acetyltransferase
VSDILERISFRPAKPDDAAALSRLAFKSKAHWGYDIDFMRRCKAELTYSPEQIEREDIHFHVCDLDDRVVAFYALKELGDGRAELDALFVAPDLLGQGVGRYLVDQARNEAIGLGIDVIVILGDPNAEGFYGSVGAVAAGYRESASIPGRFLPLFKLSTR